MGNFRNAGLTVRSDAAVIINCLICLVLAFGLAAIPFARPREMLLCLIRAFNVEELIRTMMTGPNGVEYEPAKQVISTIGIGGAATSVINGNRAARRHGVLGDSILRCFFPCHVAVSIFYIIFILVGLYACAARIGAWVAICFFGALICFVYSAVILLTLSYSAKISYLSVILYTKIAVKQGVQKRERLVRDIAGAIGGFYASSERLGLQSYSEAAEDIRLLNELLRAVPADGGTRALHEKDLKNWLKLPCPDRFPQLSVRTLAPDEEWLDLWREKWWGATELSGAFTQRLTMSRTAWSSCFDAAGDSLGKRAELSKDALLNCDSEIALTVLCGLLLHLRSGVDPMDSRKYKDAWFDCLDFLILLHTRLSAEDMDRSGPDGMRLSEHLPILTVCLLYTEVACMEGAQRAFNGLNGRVVAFLRKTAAKDAFDRTIKDPDSLHRYYACSLLICWQYNDSLRLDQSKANVARWCRYVEKQFDEWRDLLSNRQ